MDLYRPTVLQLMWWCCITGCNSLQRVSQSLVPAIYKASHCSASACKLSLHTKLCWWGCSTFLLPCPLDHCSKIMPLYARNVWWPYAERASGLQDGPSKGVHCRTECDTAYYELFISVFCIWRLGLWSELQTSLLHWDQIQNISCGSFVVNNHRDCPNA